MARAGSSTLDALLARDGTVVGTWSQLATADAIDVLGAAGYHFTIIDCEHGAFGIETAEGLIRAAEAAGVVPLVRVPRGDTVATCKALDAGAAGVLAPSVESADEARAMVAATRFAPEGTRGACPIVRAAAHSATAWSAFVDAQRGNGLVAMIETAAGVAAADAICAVPGLKAVLVGPFDLSVSIGRAGEVDAPEVLAAIDRVLAAAACAQRPVIFPVFAAQRDAFAAQLARWRARGLRHVVVGADKIMLTQAARAYRGWVED